VALAAAAGLFLLTLVAANVVLSTRILRSALDKGPDKTHIDYGSARSLWPGHLTVRNLRIRDRDLKAEWVIELDEARVSYSVLGLLSKKFHARTVRGRGLVFRARNRREPERAAREGSRHLPPIPGFSDPPTLRTGEKRPPRTGKEWTVRVGNLAVDGVRQIWVDTARFDGDGRLTGGFSLRPKVEAEVFPTSLTVRRGRLSLGGAEVLVDLEAALDGLIRRWRPHESPGAAVVRFVDGKVSFAARSAEKAELDRLLGGFGQIRLERGRLALHGDARLREALARGAVRFSSDDFAARIVDLKFAGKLSGRLAVARYDLRTGAAELSGSHAEIRGVTLEESEAARKPWWGRVELSAGKVKLPRSPTITGRVTARARNARPLLAILKVDLPRWVKGLVDLEGVTARGDLRLGKSLLEVERLDARVGDYHVQGDYTARGKARRAVVLVDLGALSVGIGVQGEEREVQIIGPRKWFREQTGREPRDADSDEKKPGVKR